MNIFQTSQLNFSFLKSVWLWVLLMGGDSSLAGTWLGSLVPWMSSWLGTHLQLISPDPLREEVVHVPACCKNVGWLQLRLLEIFHTLAFLHLTFGSTSLW